MGVTIVRFLLTGTAVTLVVAGGKAISVEDKYALQVPNGLAFSDFRGYESWQTVSVSSRRRDDRGNPRQSSDDRCLSVGHSRQRQAFSRRRQDGEDPLEHKKSEDAPTPTIVPDALHDVDFMQKDSKKFADTHGWGYAQFNWDSASDTFKPMGDDAKCGAACHELAAGKDYVFTVYGKR